MHLLIHDVVVTKPDVILRKSGRAGKIPRYHLRPRGSLLFWWLCLHTASAQVSSSHGSSIEELVSDGCDSNRPSRALSTSLLQRAVHAESLLYGQAAPSGHHGGHGGHEEKEEEEHAASHGGHGGHEEEEEEEEEDEHAEGHHAGHGGHEEKEEAKDEHSASHHAGHAGHDDKEEEGHAGSHHGGHGGHEEEDEEEGHAASHHGGHGGHEEEEEETEDEQAAHHRFAYGRQKDNEEEEVVSGSREMPPNVIIPGDSASSSFPWNLGDSSESGLWSSSLKAHCQDRCGIRLEMYLQPPLKWIHRSREGPLAAFLAELKARLLYALSLPAERVQLLGIRGQNMGKKVKFNMMQVSDPTFLRTAFLEENAEVVTDHLDAVQDQQSANLDMISTMHTSTNLAHGPEPGHEHMHVHKPEHSERPPEAVSDRAAEVRAAEIAQEEWEADKREEERDESEGESDGEEGRNEIIGKYYTIPVIIEGGEEKENSEDEAKRDSMPAKDDSYSSGWRTADEWKGNVGTVDANTWSWESANLNGQGWDEDASWRAWDPVTGRWKDERRPEADPPKRSGGWEDWSPETAGDVYQTVIDLEFFPEKGGEAPVWIINTLKEEVGDASGRLMRGSLATILANAKVMIGGQELQGE